jgi:hypothetical protein
VLPLRRVATSKRTRNAESAHRLLATHVAGGALLEDASRLFPVILGAEELASERLTQAPSASQSGSSASRRPAFSRRTASGGFAAIASRARRGVDEPSSARRATRARCAASRASITAREEQSGRSRADGRREPREPATSAASPRSTKSSPNFRALAAMRRIPEQRALHAPTSRRPVRFNRRRTIRPRPLWRSALGGRRGGPRRPCAATARRRDRSPHPGRQSPASTASPEQNAGAAAR